MKTTLPAGLLLHGAAQHEQVQEEGEDGEDVDHVHGVLQELDFLGRPGEPEEVLQGEPRHARRLDQGQDGVLHQVAAQVLTAAVSAQLSAVTTDRVLQRLERVDDHAHDGDGHEGDGGD